MEYTFFFDFDLSKIGSVLRPNLLPHQRWRYWPRKYYQQSKRPFFYYSAMQWEDHGASAIKWFGSRPATILEFIKEWRVRRRTLNISREIVSRLDSHD